ncbi:helicase-related protein [Schaalia hyovaginalis]|uniref:helicase-related protein n=1 Tax=Schaalia hyovaginalis TaxID=29316 RepID=UPI0012B40875|nr:helicase-related protein [Schaalia hyovaginalis]MST63618.1 DUF3883 domain-containing protein [Schaalia hyovaginalis]
MYPPPANSWGGITGSVSDTTDGLPAFSLDDFDDIDEDTTPEERAHFEEQAEEVIDLATAAQTIPELQAEIAVLTELITIARQVRHRDDDKKWVELRSILDEQLLAPGGMSEARKIIIFTEHRDTLEYLESKITTLFGRADSVMTIHGGTRREDRKLARERFSHDPDAVVLLATDAAGEGLNLQRAHLMVNYDLPWNPNRIEQRFGRIHRIGQREVCHLWNLVAKDTREGDVFTRLLGKIEQMSAAYEGNLFNVLGEEDAFEERSLRDLLIEAIRYGDQPQVKAKLDRIIDSSVSDGLHEMVTERALHPEMFSSLDLDEVRARMERARERRLQPGYIAAFFIPAFSRLGGRIRRREQGRYEITRVPSRVIETARRLNRWAPLPGQYERVTFERSLMHPDGQLDAALIAPGHPLLDALIEVTIEDLGSTLERGTVLVDRRSSQAEAPMLMLSIEQRIETSSHDTAERHFDYPLIAEDGTVTLAGVPPYMEYDRPDPAEAEGIARIREGEWAVLSHDKAARAIAFREGLQPRLHELVERTSLETERTRAQVLARLRAEINHWDHEFNRLELLERQGTVGRLRAETAWARARELDERLQRRMIELDGATKFLATPAIIRGRALVIPSHILAGSEAEASAFGRERLEEVERRAVEAVLCAERALGRNPVEMPRNNPGYDIASTDGQGRIHYIEVKGRIEGSETFTITTNEVTFAHTQGDRHRLALVEVSAQSSTLDRLCYVRHAFSHLEPSATTRSYNEVWADYWARGGPAQ